MQDTHPAVTIRSPAFNDGGRIPRRHTCQGEDLSVPLEFGQAPKGARCWALIMDDPDAPVGTWSHWILWDLPVDVQALPEDADVAGLGGVEGENSWGGEGYAGPCPPSGVHRYTIRLYALSKELRLPAGANVIDLEQAIEGKVVAQGQLMGTYAEE